MQISLQIKMFYFYFLSYCLQPTDCLYFLTSTAPTFIPNSFVASHFPSLFSFLVKSAPPTQHSSLGHSSRCLPVEQVGMGHSSQHPCTMERSSRHPMGHKVHNRREWSIPASTPSGQVEWSVPNAPLHYTREWAIPADTPT